jgi:hypothetical protein
MCSRSSSLGGPEILVADYIKRHPERTDLAPVASARIICPRFEMGARFCATTA